VRRFKHQTLTNFKTKGATRSQQRKRRGKQGLSHYDFWNLDSALAKIIRNGLIDLYEQGHGFPIDCEFEHWAAELVWMIDTFELLSMFDEIWVESDFDDQIAVQLKDIALDWVKLRWFTLWD
jgi:hypothetical protein